MSDLSLTPDKLSDWLSRAGTLPRDAVTDVCVELELETTTSNMSFVTVAYSAEAPADLPRRLVVKSPLTPPTLSDGSGEVQFYRQLAGTIGTPPLVRCLAAIEDSDTTTIVLEDLRATHDHPPWPLPLSQTHCKLALDALAGIHAQWWEAPTLGHAVSKFHTPESLTKMVQGITAHLPAFIDALGDALTVEDRKLYERVFSSSLKPWMRLTDQRALTVIHGDAHAWNFLFPRSGEGAAFVLDWQLWHLDVGARDLAFLMLHWYPSRRRELERPLMRHYYERLLAHGVSDYAFDELWLDYRRCAVRNLTLPIIFWSRGMKPEGWWHRLQSALAAYRDLSGDELL